MTDHYGEFREAPPAEDSQSLVDSIQEDNLWQSLMSIEALNRNNPQLKRIRSKNGDKVLNCFGCPARLAVIEHNGNTGLHYNFVQYAQ